MALEEKDIMVGGPEDSPIPDTDKGAGPVDDGQTDDTPERQDEPVVEDTKKDTPNRKFKTWEEAERAHEEATRKISQLGEESSKLRRRFDEIEKSKEPAKDEMLEKRKAIRKEAYEKIAKLSTDLSESERSEQSGDIWLEASAKISRLENESIETERKGKSEMQNYVEDKLKDAGFTDATEKDFFWNYIVPKMPSYLKNASLDDQVEWGTEQLTKLVSTFTERIKKGLEEDGEDKKKLNVLGKGSSIRTGKKGKDEEEENVSLRDLQRKIRSERAAKS